MNNKNSALFLVLAVWMMGTISCSRVSPTSPSAPPGSLNFLNGDLSSEFPLSRYLSDQSIVNVRFPGTRTGYDPDYKQLAFRRLERIPQVRAPGVRAGTRVVIIPRNQQGYFQDEITSQELINRFGLFINESNAHFTTQLTSIQNLRSTRASNSSPRVTISGLGPIGLLAALEAYTSGSSVVAVEQRSQYTRPQVLRLTPDTIGKIKFFLGEPLWDYLKRRGVVSSSPNWAYNKFDQQNWFLQQRNRALNLNSFFVTASDNAFLNEYSANQLDIKNVEIIRINHLETILATFAELLAKSDSSHFKIFYGSKVEVTSKNPSTYDLSLKIYSGIDTVSHSFSTDILVASEGGGSPIVSALNLGTQTLSKTLRGATVALRLPVGFDISLRPIENTYGTASVKGIAKIDPEKLGTWDSYTWSMIDEHALCNELNDVLRAAALRTQVDVQTVVLPCGVASLHPEWQKLNGGETDYLPRTRYFFTGGIAYLGAELTESQYNLFNMEPDKEGLADFMLTMAKKHMPQEYVSGQGRNGIHRRAQASNASQADRVRVVTITERPYSLTLFPVELRKANEAQVIRSFTQVDGRTRPVRVIRAGDAFATTHFFTGSGAVNGLRAAIYIGEALTAGNTESAWNEAAQKISDATDLMHQKVMMGGHDSPLDGPFNEPL